MSWLTKLFGGKKEEVKPVAPASKPIAPAASAAPEMPTDEPEAEEVAAEEMK
jgi:hypothetical protein